MSVEDWAEIRRLHRAEGMPIKAIARVLGVSRNTVRAALRQDGPPKYERQPAGSVGGCGRAADPGAAAGVSDDAGDGDRRADRLGPGADGAEGPGARSCARSYLPPDPASRGRAYVAGEIAQCDLWFPPIELPVGFGQVAARPQLPVLTMVTGYSRWLSAVLIPSRHGGGPVRGVVAADRARWGRCRGCWSGTARARSAGGGGGRTELTGRVPGVPRHAGRQGGGLQARPIRRPRAWSSGRTTTWSARSCPAGRSPARRTSTPSCGAGWRW